MLSAWIPLAGQTRATLSGYVKDASSGDPLIGAVVDGVVTCASDEGEYAIAVGIGVVNVVNNSVTVLSRTAEEAENIDLARAEAAEKRARERLAAKNADTDAARAEDDFRPLADSPVLASGTTNEVWNFSVFTIGGIHGACFPAGRLGIGASSDVAVPVTVTNMRGIALSGGLGTPFVSAMYPLTLTATDTGRNFCGFYVNGALATKERTLTLEMLDGVASYSVEPVYASGTMMIIR